MCNVIDATYASGGVMLATFFAPNNVTTESVAFDSVTIKSIGSNAPDEGDTVMDPAAFAPVATPANMNPMLSSSR